MTLPMATTENKSIGLLAHLIEEMFFDKCILIEIDGVQEIMRVASVTCYASTPVFEFAGYLMYGEERGKIIHRTVALHNGVSFITEP